MENQMNLEEFEALSKGAQETLKTIETIFGYIANTSTVLSFGISVASLFDDKIENIFKDFQENIDETFGDLKKKIGNIQLKVDNVKTTEEIRQIGKELVDGLDKGIKDNLYKVEKTMAQMNKKLIEISEEVMGVQSPSKVMERIGEYISEGLEIGIRKGSDDVVDAAKDLGDGIDDEIGGRDFSFGGLGAAFGVITAIGGAFTTLMSTNEEFGAAVDEVWTQITEAFAPVTEAVMNLITSLGEEGMGGSFSWFSDALNGVSELAVSVK